MPQPPRPMHYYFVHRFLRDRALEYPAPLLEDLRRKDAVQYLSIHWVMLSLEMDLTEDERIKPHGIKCHTVDVGADYTGVIVEFPPPERLSEAFMAAILIPTAESGADKLSSRYYTLEYNPEREHQTSIGSWWADGMHLNHGAGSPPTMENFTQDLFDLLYSDF